MFGLFDGLFGEGFMADAAETALGMCLIDEMEGEFSDNLDLEDLDDFNGEDY